MSKRPPQYPCPHNNRKWECGICRPELFCPHMQKKSRCWRCGGHLACSHKKLRAECRECNGYLAVARQLYRGAKWRAKRDSLPFDLTVAHILELIGDGVCPVLGTPFSVFSRRPSDTSATLDKFFPDMGYVKGNCAVISKLANSIKTNATATQVRLVAEWMYKNAQLRTLHHP